MRGKRKFLTVMALSLALVMTLTALAEGKLLTLWHAGAHLLFETDNVTLSAEATFTYDGEEFKRFTGTYRQDGSSTFMQTSFDTPREDGTTYTGGYTVISGDGFAYSMNTDTPNFYNVGTASTKESVLTNTVMRASLMRFGGLLLELLEGDMDGAITQQDNDAGTLYHIALKREQTPEIIDAGLTLAAQLAAKEYFGVDPQDVAWMFEPADNYFGVIWKDWEASMATLYEKTYGVPLPENYYSLLWDENGEPLPEQLRYEEITSQMADVVENLEAQHETGVALVGEDLDVTYYDTYDAYIVATGQQEVYFMNHSSATKRYYEKLTGTPLTSEMLQAASRNEKVHEAFHDMTMQMTEEYADIAREAGASGVLVYDDGSYALSYDVRTLSKVISLASMTPTRRILYSMREMAVGDADVRVQLDAQGRIVSAGGSVTLLVRDYMEDEHALKIDFNATADTYGETHVEAFDPADYNVISYGDYYSGNYDPAMFAPPTVTPDPTLPQAIIFNGVEYDLTETAEEDING